MDQLSCSLLSIFRDVISEKICITDDQRSVIFVTNSFLKLLGYDTDEELLGKQITEFFHSTSQPNKADDFSGVSETVSYTINGKDKSFQTQIARKQIPLPESQTRIWFFSIPDTVEEDQTSFIEEKGIILKNAFYSLSIALFSKIELPELLNEILEQVGRVIAFDSASISLMEDDCFSVVAAKGFEDEKDVIGISFKKVLSSGKRSPNIEAIDKRKSQIMRSVEKEYPEFINPPNVKIKSWMVIPLLTKDGGIGTLNLDCYHENGFSSKDQYYAELFAAQVAVAIENALKYLEIEREAKIDHLTGLLSRKELVRQAEIEIEKNNKKRTLISELVVDIDNFKQINDKNGHYVGDEILRSIARTCTLSMRKKDFIGRYGGDEFIIILPDTTLSEGKKLAERLCKLVNDQDYKKILNQMKVTVSI